MLPEPLIAHSVRDGEVVPHFLCAADHPWLRSLLDEFAAAADRPEHHLHERLAHHTTGCRDRRVLAAVHVLWRLVRRPAPHDPRPAAVRALVFEEAASSPGDPAIVLATVATKLGRSVAAVREALFADLPRERPVGTLPAGLTHVALALRVNLALAQALLYRSTGLRVALEGNARAVVRHARLQGLLCYVESGSVPVLAISGPYSLFRRTLVYGRALSTLLPQLAWCRRFALEATCVLAGQQRVLRLRTGIPIPPAKPPAAYDSRLEARFARDLRRIAPEWDVVREPTPIAAGGTLVFPDFALHHRTDGRSWLVEIAGFWTPEYVTRKLERLRAARLDNLILCIDEARRCSAAELPPTARVVRYRRRVDAAAVAALLGD